MRGFGMDAHESGSDAAAPGVEWATILPGSDRKKTESPYTFRLRYCNTTPRAVGCVMTWDVQGGRLQYQIAVEREAGGRLRCHCTCADAIYRAENEGRHCKHVNAFLARSRAGREAAPDPSAPIRRGA
jgi:hypothetical protein